MRPEQRAHHGRCMRSSQESKAPITGEQAARHWRCIPSSLRPPHSLPDGLIHRIGRHGAGSDRSVAQEFPRSVQRRRATGRAHSGQFRLVGRRRSMRARDNERDKAGCGRHIGAQGTRRQPSLSLRRAVVSGRRRVGMCRALRDRPRMKWWAWYALTTFGGATGALACGSGSSPAGVPDASARENAPEASDSQDAAPDNGDGSPTSMSSCPSSPPAEGAACAGSPVCSYDDNPRPACRTTAVCAPPACGCGSDTCPPGACPADAGKSWAVGSDWAAGLCAPPDCPGTSPEDAGSCSQLYAYCPLADGTPCGCLSGSGGTRWICLPLPADPRCPKVAPALGSACAAEGLACGTYDICVTGSRVLCTGGVWLDNGGNCPD
jgi:hypothetical protein